MGSDEGFVVGVPVSSRERSARRGRSGRECADESCRTRLSIYNDGRFCSLHAPMVVPRTRGRKPDAA